MKLQNIFLPILAISANFGMSMISCQTNQALSLDEPLGIALERKSDLENLNLINAAVQNKTLPQFPINGQLWGLGEIWYKILKYNLPQDLWYNHSHSEITPGFLIDQEKKFLTISELARETELPEEFYDSIVKYHFQKSWDDNGDFSSILEFNSNSDRVLSQALSKERYEYLIKSALVKYLLLENRYLGNNDSKDRQLYIERLIKVLKLCNCLPRLNKDQIIIQYREHRNKRLALGQNDLLTLTEGFLFKCEILFIDCLNKLKLERDKARYLKRKEKMQKAERFYIPLGLLTGAAIGIVPVYLMAQFSEIGGYILSFGTAAAIYKFNLLEKLSDFTDRLMVESSDLNDSEEAEIISKLLSLEDKTFYKRTKKIL